MKSYPFVSIIIPTRRDSEILKQCIDSLRRQDYPPDAFEIILVSKEELMIQAEDRIYTISGLDFIDARNEGVKKAKGQLIAFVDDDCIMPEDWMSKTVPYFQDPKVGVVGGPALPFEKDDFVYQVGKYLLSSAFTSGFASTRYKLQKSVQEVQEHGLIGANSFVRKDVFDSISGFDREQVLSEENDLYFRITQQGYKLLYVPEIYVWHRAKPIVLPLIKKVFFYATGRGVLMVRKPKTFRLLYLIPTFFLLGSVFLPLASLFFGGAVIVLTFLVFLVYFVLNLLNSLFIFLRYREGFLVIPLVFFLTPVLHYTYGIGVVYGAYLYITGRFKEGRRLWTED